MTGTSQTGGLAGARFGRATASYWDTTTSGQTTSASGTGHTTAELQAPTGYSGIYATWNVDLDGDGTADDVWDFGTASEYPVLKVDFDGDGTASWQEFGDQRPAPPNQAPTFTDGATTTRMVAENTVADEPFGEPVTATDEDAGDTLTYSLDTTAATSFGIDSATGQLQTLAALDYETTPSYVVTVTVSDGRGGTASSEVTITVTDVLDTPPPAPANLMATPAVTSVALSWDAVAGASQYQVDYRLVGAETWTTAAADLTGLEQTVADLTCHSDYEVQVLAYGDGVAYTAAWGDPTGALPVTTTVCPPPTFGAEAYSFTVGERTAVDAEVGGVIATTTGSGPVTYAITAGNTGTAFAIGETTGQLTVAGALSATTTASYDLTVQASAGGSQAVVPVTITVAPLVLTAPPPPANLMATPAATSVALTWDAVPGAARYEVESLAAGQKTWTSEADDVTGTTHTVTDLTCASLHQVRVRTFGDGVTHTAAWGEPTTALPVMTTACGPTPGAPSYSFRVIEGAGTDTVVGTVTATAAGTGALTYAITAGNEAGAFAIGATTGQLTVAGSLDAASYALTVGVTEAGGGTATVPVSITVTAVPAVPAVTVAFGAATYATTEGAASGVTVTVSLSADPEREVTIPLTVTLQDGAEAADYSGVPASVTIASGSTAATFVVTAVDDTVDDDGESIQLGFGTDLPAGVTVAATEGAVTTTTISLADNDATPVPAVTVAFGAATYATTEGAASGVTVTVALSADPQREITIPLTVTGQGGAEAADYTGVPTSVSFAAGATSTSFVVVAVDDALDDDGEAIQLGFGDLPAQVMPGAPATTTLSLVDNDASAEPTDRAVWSATLTVATFDFIYLGYRDVGDGPEGVLTDADFEWRGVTYTVVAIIYSPHTGLDVILEASRVGSLPELTLHLDDVALAVADAEVYGGPLLIWDAVRLDWAADAMVTVRLTAAASDTSSGS